MSFFRFLFSKIFLLNLLIAVVVLVLLFWGSLKLLNRYTLHGETISVPNLTGLKVKDAEDILEEKGLRYMVNDSVFDSKAKRGAIIDQDPKPDVQVKHNRTIYLTVNAVLPPKVKMPNLVDLSLRQTTAVLETYGLRVGNLTYVPDIAFNAVLKQQVKGKNILPGEMVEKGTAVDLVLGQGESEEMVPLPDLTDMTVAEAVSALNAASLNLGSVIKDATVTDSTRARVYRQLPEYAPGARINAGKAVDIFIAQ